MKLPSELAGKAAAFLQKYRYPALILVIGLVLLALLVLVLCVRMVIL